MKPQHTLCVLVAIAGSSVACKAQTETLTPDEARAIAHEAYVYGFPLVDSYRVQHSYFADPQGKEYKGDWNVVHNIARVYTPEDKAI